MSISDLQAYGKRAATDPDVSAAVKALGTADLQAHIEYAQTLGYEFTPDDVMALARERKPDGELTDEELAAVSGGSVLLLLLALGLAGAAAAGIYVYTEATKGNGGS